MPRLTTATLTPLEIARQLDSWGFNVLPTPIRQKAPRVPWKKWADERTTRMLTSWFPTTGASNYWIATGGPSQCYVLDIDNRAADEWWREAVKYGDVMDQTVRAKTSKGMHYYFWVPENDMARGWAFHEQGLDFDVRGVGGGVVVPPSVHESGVIYEWVKAPDPDQPMNGMIPAPDWLKSREGVRTYLLGEEAPKPSGSNVVQLKPATGPSRNGTVSMLSSLLANPAPESGRNDWLTHVAGHYAKTYRKQYDLFVAHLQLANRMLDKPLDDDEFNKTANSIWTTETTAHPERDIESTGWLLSGGDRILTQAARGKGEEMEKYMAEWSDFDIRVQGVMAQDGDEGNTIYDVQIRKQRGSERVVTAMLPGKIVGQPQKLSAWLGGFGCSIARPDGCWPAQPPDNVRLLRYLDSQDAPRARMSRTLGWDDSCDGFLTFDGVIRRDGAHPFSGVRPNPALATQNVVRFYYGFQGDWAEAQSVLREVLTFHDETAAAVFGSWWAASLIKPQLTRQTSMFPVMGIEAASGAGKTNGMFSLLLQLSGSLEGPGTKTVASMRDRLAAHHNGIAWLDDLEQLGRLQELLRVSTSGESITKKDINNEGNVTSALVSPIIVSGETLGFGEQKALLDRTVLLNPPKPDGRMSLKPGREDHPQWDDIVELMDRYPFGQDGELGLTALAGHLIVRSLNLAEAARAQLRKNHRQVKKDGATGRVADKIAILYTGGWLLDRLVDDELTDDGVTGPWEAQIRAWTKTADSTVSAGEWDNRLTLAIAPWALRDMEWPTSPKGAPPAFVKRETDLLGPEVWVNLPKLAEAWRDHMRGRIVERTDTEKALLDQVRRCQEVPRQARLDTSRHSGKRMQMVYWCLPPEVSQVVLDRSEGHR